MNSFETQGILFKESSFEQYREHVDRRMREPFLHSDFKLIRVPPIYRDEMIQYMKQKYSKYKIETHEISGIWVYGDVDASTEYAISQIESGSGIIDVYNLDEVLERLKVHFPLRKFEIQTESQIYEGMDMSDRDFDGNNRRIVVDDFEIYGKWHPTYFVGSLNDWLMKSVQEVINKGFKIIHTDHNEKVIELLRKEFPDKKFQIKMRKDVFPWIKEGDFTLIVIDDFIVPRPKNYKATI